MSLSRWGCLVFCLAVLGCAHAPKRDQGQRILRQGSGQAKDHGPKDQNPYFYLIRSNLLSFEGKLESSLEDLEKAMAVFPEDPFLQYLAAERYAKLNDLEKAKGFIEAALKFKPDWLEAKMLQAQILEAMGGLEKAGVIFQELVRARPNEEENWFQLAQNLVQRGKYAQAIQALDSWLAKNPDSPMALYYIGTIQNVYLKNPTQALQTFQKLLQIDSEDLRVRNQLAQIYLNQNNKAKALEEFLKIEQKVPNDLSIKLQIAFLYQEMDQVPKAIAKLKEMLLKNPQADRVDYYLGLLYEKIKQDTEALNYFAKVPPTSSLYKEAVLHRTALLREHKEFEPAIQLLKAAIRKKPEVAPFYQMLAWLWEDSEQADAAVEVLKDGIQKIPMDEELHFNLGSLYDRLKRREESTAMMRKVLEINPENASALNYIGYTYAETGKNLEEAEALVLKAMKIKPGDGYITDSLGWVYFQRGDMVQALHYIRQAYKILPEEPVIVEHMGDIFLKLKNKAQAANYFRRALQAGKKKPKPNREEIERVEAKLRALQ